MQRKHSTFVDIRIHHTAGNWFTMTDDGNDDLAKLRRQQRLASAGETEASSDWPSQATDASSTSTSSPTRDELEQRVLGAVRQAVTDVLQEGKRPTDLPSIDMDFVATPRARDTTNALHVEPIHPSSDDQLSVAPINPPANLGSSPTEKSAMPLVVVGIGLVLIVGALIFSLPGDDQDLFGSAPGDTTDRQVAKPFDDPDQVRLSASAPVSSHLLASGITAGNGSGAGTKHQEAVATAARDGELREGIVQERQKSGDGERQPLPPARAAEVQVLRAAAEQRQQQELGAGREQRAALRAAKQRQQLEADRKRLAALRDAEDKTRRQAAERRLKQQEQEAERQRLSDLRAAVETARREAAERRQQLADQAERVRVAMLREAEQSARREATLRKQKAAGAAERKRIAAVRAAHERSLAEIGIRDPVEMDDLVAATRKRLRSEGVITARLNAVLEEAKQARLRSDRLQANSAELPGAWAAEEKARLKLEQLLAEISKEQATAAAPRLRNGPSLIRNTVTLRLKESNLKITGVLVEHNARRYVVQLPSNEQVTLPVEHFNCISTSCPQSSN